MHIKHANWDGKISEGENARPLILFFLGYSFTPDCIAHLEIGDADLSVVYDYTNLNVNLDFIQNRNVYLIAWSMGVWAAAQKLSERKDFTLKKAVAINGTPLGIDDKFGIPAKVFLQSIEQFNFEAFKKGCFLGDLAKVQFTFNENPKAELETIYDAIVNQKQVAGNLSFAKAIVSKKDFIFPPTASEYFTCPHTTVLAPHYPFFKFTSIRKILEDPS